MAYSLSAKAPTEVVERRWTVPVDDNDSPLSVVLAASGVTVDSNSFEADELVLVLSSGTNGTTATITATVTTAQGRVLVETLYIPIVVSTVAIGDTARNICTFALRKVVGAGMTPTAAEMDDALERLNLMLAGWQMEGADVGTFLPLTANSVVACPDYMVEGIKYNMILQIAGRYEYSLSDTEVLHARRGLQRIKQSLLPSEAVVYF